MRYWLWKRLLSHGSPAGSDAKLHVFIFHRVLAQADPLQPDIPDARSFDSYIRFIAGSYNVLSFGEATLRLQAGTLPQAAACITFDDGYRDNATIAFPILKKYDVPATFFIATEFIGDGRMWNDNIIEAIRAENGPELNWQRYGLGHYSLRSNAERAHAINQILPRVKYLPHIERCQLTKDIAQQYALSDKSNLMMTREQITQLNSCGMEIGGHTHSHPILSSLTEAEAEADIARGKIELESLLGKAVDVFAYPNGNTKRDLTDRDVNILGRLGYRAAATTDHGLASSNTNPYLIPRFTPWDRTSLRFALRCAALQLNYRSSPSRENYS